MPTPDVDLDLLAMAVSYEPSAEHKDYLTSAGLPRLRTDATSCPRDLDFDDVAGWLRESVRRGDVSADLENGFPRYVWTRKGDTCYEGRLSNSTRGSYHGYPLRDVESPPWLR